jgi:hypothetical protein
VSPLFRRSEDKVARRAAARQEIDRLRALHIDDLTMAVWPGLGPDGPTHGASVTRQKLARYLLVDHPGAGRTDELDLLLPVRKALERLEGIGLVTTISVQREPYWRLTPLGESVMADGTVGERLQGR